MGYIYEQEATRNNKAKWWTSHFDDYDEFMQAGSAGELGRRMASNRSASGGKFSSIPVTMPSGAISRGSRAGDPTLKVPVMLVHSLWDQEDIYGAMAVYKAIKPKDTDNDKSSVMAWPSRAGDR